MLIAINTDGEAVVTQGDYERGEDLSKPPSEACGAGPLHNGRPAQQRNLVLSTPRLKGFRNRRMTFELGALDLYGITTAKRTGR